jgi:hypothetical protein
MLDVSILHLIIFNTLNLSFHLCIIYNFFILGTVHIITLGFKTKFFLFFYYYLLLDKYNVG